MNENDGRLVPRIQHRLIATRPGEARETLAAWEVAELDARIRRLRAFGRGFAHVGLSRAVANCVAGGEFERVGGVCVARDV